MTQTAAGTLDPPAVGTTTGPEPAAASGKRRTRIHWFLLLPGVVGLLVSYVLPLAWMIRMSFNQYLGTGRYAQAFTFESYVKPFTDGYYWKVTLDTFTMGLVVGVVCVLASYPISLFLVRTTSRWRGVLIALALTPLLTSAIVRTYGWMVILRGNGLVNSSLEGLGVISTPLRLTNNMTGVVIGLVEIFMPYAILTMMSGFGRLSTQLEEAAGSLGASRFRVFARITLPLSLPGVLAAFLLVFVLSISTFITPRLLGGGTVHVLATEIYDETDGLLNWPFAAALSVILLVLFGAVIAVYQRLVKKLGV